MSARIDNDLLDHYVRASGDPAQLPPRHDLDMELWDLVDELLLDLHLIRHGYADAGYHRHVERELSRSCTDDTVIQRMKDLRL